MKFLKVELLNTDQPVYSEVDADNAESLLAQELAAYQADDRLGDDVVGLSVDLSVDDMEILWEPGDGGQYTVARYQVVG